MDQKHMPAIGIDAPFHDRGRAPADDRLGLVGSRRDGFEKDDARQRVRRPEQERVSRRQGRIDRETAPPISARRRETPAYPARALTRGRNRAGILASGADTPRRVSFPAWVALLLTP
ncbi:hypothetical protein [Brytella acorum]|nr:hypothetical protein [Brytella acorum]MDF3625947.1 hypothetical protein [Brytella acorum]